jgi:hypothetical protein
MYKKTEFRKRAYSHARRWYISKPAGSNGCLPLLQIQGAVGIRVCFLQLHQPRRVSRSLLSPRKGDGNLRFEECGHVCVCSRVCLNTHTRFTRALSLIRIHTHSHTNQFSGLVLVEFASLALHVDFKILDADSTHLQGIECIERKQEHVLQ